MRLLPLLAAALCGAASPTPALAVEAPKTVAMAAPPAKVWATIGDFCGIADWHPAVEKCVVSMQDGKPLRTLSLKGGGTIVELQTARDDAAMTYSYTILDGPLPVAHYLSTIAVKPSGSGSIVTWSGSFDAKGASDEVAQGVIAGIYDSGLAGIDAKAK